MYSFNIYSLLSLVVSFVYLLLSVYILLKNPRSQVNRLFGFVGLTMFIWGVSEGLERASVNPETAYFWAIYIIGLGSSFHPAFLLHFWLAFSGKIKRFKYKTLVLFLYLPSLIFTIIRFIRPELLIKELVHQYWGYSTEGTSLYLLYMLYVAAYTLLVVYLVFRTASKNYGKIKKQAQYIGIGISFSVFVAIATQVSRPVLHFPIPELTVISTMVFIYMIASAVNKYGMMAISTKLVAGNIIGTIEDYVIAIDKQMKIALVNNSALRDLGYKEKELIDKPLSAIFSADVSYLSYDQALERFPLRNYQAEIISKKGEKISVSANASLLKEGPSDIFGFVFVLRDMRQINKLIEDLRIAKTEVEKIVAIRTKELQEEEARLVASINSLPMGFAIVDVKGALAIANPKLLKLFSLGKKALSFSDVSRQIPDKIDGKEINLDAERERVLRNKETIEIKEIPFRDRFIRIFLSPVIFAQEDREEVIGIVFLVEDITEQKRLEEAKDSFVAITAHELRTPLTIVRGNAELILGMFPKKLSDPQIKTMVEAVQRSSVRLLGIVDDFLNLTRLEEGKMPFKNERFNLVDVVNEVVADFKVKAVEKSLSLRVVPPSKPLTDVFADQDKAKEIVINILGNAMQYTEKGGVTLSFVQNDGFIELSVKDTGIGIEQNEQKLLFQKFQTVGKHFMHSKEYGSGMGLYISRLLAEFMNGTVRLKESSPGQGSTFVISLPIYAG